MTEAVETTATETTTTDTSATAALTGGQQAAEQTPSLPDGAFVMPGKEATAEDWGAFYAKLGRPDTAEGYELPLPEGDDGAFAKQVAPMLHKAGLTGDQAKALAAEWNTFQAAQTAEATAAEQTRVAAMDAQNRAEAAALQTEWGTNHTANMEHAKRAVSQFLPKEQAGDIIAAIESKVGYRKTIEMLYGIGRGLAEHDAAGMSENAGAPSKSLANRLYPGLQ